MAKFFQVSIKGQKPCGGLFQTRQEAQREISFLKADDLRYAKEAFEEAGVVIECPDYEIHEVDIAL
jgi:hypothetical protein